MVTLDLAITPQKDTLPIYSSQFGKENGLWISVEIDGKVSSSAG